jgi:tRNA-dihydrouridine synthase 3
VVEISDALRRCFIEFSLLRGCFCFPRSALSSTDAFFVQAHPPAHQTTLPALPKHNEKTNKNSYRKAADWDLIQQVAAQRRADAASTGLPPVPIIGNGDFLTWYEVERRGIFLGGGGDGAESSSSPSSIHAAMIGRGALVKPWIWQECRERRELFLSAEDRVGVYRQLVAHMKAYFRDDDRGRAKAFYFLPWHFNFFHRYRPFPKDEYEALSLKQPLLSTRVTLWDKGKEAEGAEGVPWLERLLRCENERAFDETAAVLWDSCSDSDAVTGLERLSREKVRDWERELYEKEQAQARTRRDGGESAESEEEEVEG